MALTYQNYLNLNELLSIQKPASDPEEHDEMLFIVIHQVFELWFKEVIHELTYLRKTFENNEIPASLATLKRILTIFKTLVAQIDILETLTPLGFKSFRDRLGSASGLQSTQFRTLEYILGKRDTTPQSMIDPNIINAPPIFDSFLKLLKRNNYNVPENLQKILIDIYHHNFLIAQVCERLIDLDEGFQEWRYRHLKMVERTIGDKTGTGGTSGADYLKSTLFKPLFPDLWAIRNNF